MCRRNPSISDVSSSKETQEIISDESYASEMRSNAEKSVESTTKDARVKERLDTDSKGKLAGNLGARKAVSRLQRKVINTFDERQKKVTGNGERHHREVAYRNVGFEARHMLRSIAHAEAEDEARKAHNARMAYREMFLALLGVFCLMFPALLLFNAIIGFFPGEYQYVLGLTAQEDTYLASVSVFCLKALELAGYASELNQSSAGYMATCVVTLISILMLVRHTTKRVFVRTQTHREMLRIMSSFIKEELERRRRTLLPEYYSSEQKE